VRTAGEVRPLQSSWQPLGHHGRRVIGVGKVRTAIEDAGNAEETCAACTARSPVFGVGNPRVCQRNVAHRMNVPTSAVSASTNPYHAPMLSGLEMIGGLPIATQISWYAPIAHAHSKATRGKKSPALAASNTAATRRTHVPCHGIQWGKFAADGAKSPNPKPNNPRLAAATATMPSANRVRTSTRPAGKFTWRGPTTAVQ
jgi:hypothetical protein